MMFIGVDPHKLSATIEVVDERETVLATGRFGTDKAGYAAMRRHVDRFPERTWAVEGSNGAGRPLAQRLLADGERVVDVPSKLRARARLFDTGHNRKTDAHDAHAVAVVAVRTAGLRVLAYDEALEALRMVADRRAELAQHRDQTVNRLHRLLSELTPGKSKEDLTALQAKAILASVRPRDLAGKTRRRLAAELLADLVAVDKRIKASTKELKTMVQATGSTLMDLPGDGPVVAARILADVGDVARLADRNRFASWTGTAPLDASSGEQIRHRLSRAGNRKVNHMLHIAAASQIRLDTPGRAYYRRKRAAGKTPMEAMRCLKRRISDAVYRQLLADARRADQPARAMAPQAHRHPGGSEALERRTVMPRSARADVRKSANGRNGHPLPITSRRASLPFQLRAPGQIGRAERWTPAPAKRFKYWIAVVGVVLVGFTATMLWGWTAGLIAVVAGVWLQEKLVLAPVDEDLPAQSSPHEEDSPARKGVA